MRRPSSRSRADPAPPSFRPDRVAAQQVNEPVSRVVPRGFQHSIALDLGGHSAFMTARQGPEYEKALNSAYLPELSKASPGTLNRDTMDMPSSDRFAAKPGGLPREVSSSS